jgi:hypothetical protein
MCDDNNDAIIRTSQRPTEDEVDNMEEITITVATTTTVEAVVLDGTTIMNPTNGTIVAIDQEPITIPTNDGTIVVIDQEEIIPVQVVPRTEVDENETHMMFLLQVVARVRIDRVVVTTRTILTAVHETTTASRLLDVMTATTIGGNHSHKLHPRPSIQIIQATAIIVVAGMMAVSFDRIGSRIVVVMSVAVVAVVWKMRRLLDDNLRTNSSNNSRECHRRSYVAETTTATTMRGKWKRRLLCNATMWMVR